MKKIKGFFRFVWRHKIWTAIVVLVLVGFALILRPKAPPAPDVTTVSRSNLVQTVSVSGTVAAKNQAVLAFLSSGLVTYIGAKQGDSVTAGQTIAVLDQRTVLKNLQNSLLSYDLQRNTYDQNVANNGGRINPDDALNDAMKRIIQNNQYNLDQAVVSVELQDLARQQSVLSSPINGILTQASTVTVGTTVSPTATFTITDPTSLVFNMDVDEADIGKIALDQKVAIVLDAYPNDTLNLPVSRIDFISHTTSNGGNAFTVEVKLPTDEVGKYRIGMNGNADITTAVKNDVMTVPLSSISNGNQVYVKTPKGFVKRTITTGLQNDTDTEVINGLSAGQQVAIQPQQVTPQMIVR